MIYPAKCLLVWAAALTGSLAQSPDTSSSTIFPGNLTATGVTLNMLIMRAYRVHSFQVSPGPKLNLATGGSPGLAEQVALSTGRVVIERTGLPKLGLRLEPQKGPVEILVIDHVEKASEN